MRSRSSPSSTTPTPTRGTRRPRRSSRRSPRPTTSSVTPPSAPSTTRCARWSPPASVPTVPADSGPADSGQADSAAAVSRSGSIPTAAGSATSSATCSVVAADVANGVPQRGLAARSRSRDRVAHPVRRRGARRHLDGAVPRRSVVLDLRRIRRRARHDAGDVSRVPRHRNGRRQPGTVLVLAGVPHLWRAGPDHPHPVPHVRRSRRRGAGARGEGAHPRGRRRRAAHPGQGSRCRGRQRRSARRPLRDRGRARAPAVRAFRRTTSRCDSR